VRLAAFAVALAACLFAAPAAIAADDPPPEAALGAALAKAAERASGPVVMIETIGGLAPAQKPPPQPEGKDKNKKKKGPGIMPRGFQQAAGPTTGIIVSADGFILTSSFNFRRKPSHVFATLPGGEQRVAKLLGQDHTRGVALVKVEAEGLPTPRWAPRDSVRVGRFVAALGRGYGYDDPSLHFGIVSALDRIHGKAVQTDAKTSPVNYGGPLVDLEGRIVGIIVPLSMRGAMAGVNLYDSGIGFAIPAWDLPELIETLKDGREIHPAFLGIQPDPRKTGDGVVIAKVVPESAAAKAGLRPGETIISINGKELASFLELFAELGKLKAGDRVTLGVRSADGTKERTVEVVLDKPK
jgi:serine protease Do